MAAVLDFLIRFVHVLGMAVVFGGAVFVWVALRVNDLDPLPLVNRYEWVFWATLGVMLVTGVGNLGALGSPAPTTRWGTLLTAKLLLVLVLVVGSFLRTLVVLRLRRYDSGYGSRASLPRQLYALTAGLLLLIVALAEVLAHD